MQKFSEWQWEWLESVCYNGCFLPHPLLFPESLEVVLEEYLPRTCDYRVQMYAPKPKPRMIREEERFMDE